MQSLIRVFFILLVGSGLVAPTPAYALSLDEAKAQGVVGETPGGYLGIVSGKSSAEAQAMLNSINSQRKERYTQIAKKNGTPLQVVEQLAGKKAIENTKPGQYVQQLNGSWIKK